MFHGEGAVFLAHPHRLRAARLFAGIVQFIRWRAKAITQSSSSPRVNGSEMAGENPERMFVDIHLRTAPFGWARALLKVVTDAEAPAAA